MADQGTSGALRAAPSTGRAANRRADAQRNRARILAATAAAISKNVEASIADIAAEAGVGRMTLYGHFGTRAELIEAALVDTLDKAEVALGDVPLDGDARDAFRRLVSASWDSLDQSRALLATAQKELSAERIRELHERAESRMRALLLRGQRDGTVRHDLPVRWLLTTTHVVLNGAAEEVRTGEISAADAPRLIEAVLVPAISPPPPREAGT